MSIIRQVEVHILPAGELPSRQAVMHQRFGANAVATLAMELMKAAVTNTAIMDPVRIVDRCVRIADEGYRMFEQKGWLFELPTWDELNEPKENPGFGVKHG